MCGHLLEAGFAIKVHNRTREKAEKLLQAGAQWGETPKAVAAGSDVIFTMLGYPSDVRNAVLGEDGVLAGCRGGNIIVDMTTSEPSLAVRIAEQAAELGAVGIDAPVSGGDVGAREAKLSIMIGGDEEAVEALMPCWQAMGETIVRQGGPGAGQHTKMVNQIVIATNMIGVCEGLLYAYTAGLDLETVMESVGSGAAASWTLANLGRRIMDGDFDPGFFVEHFVKDMGIALEESKRMGLSMPGLALAHQLYVALMAQGHRRDGTQALHLALASLSGIDWK
jgi:3-hydroxyisobutyrate dehydrogenase